MEIGSTRKRQRSEQSADSHSITASSSVSLPPIRQHSVLSGRRGEHDSRALPPLLTPSRASPLHGHHHHHHYHHQHSPLSPSSSPGPETLLRHSTSAHISGHNSVHSKRPRLQLYHHDSPTAAPSQQENVPRSSADPGAMNERMKCCGPQCKGHSCLKTRSVFQDLTKELILLDSHLTTALGPLSNPPTQMPQVESSEFDRIASWALDVVKFNNINIQEKTSGTAKQAADHNPNRIEHGVGSSSKYDVKRHNAPSDHASPDHIPGRNEQSPLLPPPSSSDERKFATEIRASPRTGCSNTTAFAVSHSPPSLAQTQRMLPSPTSMSFPAFQAPSAPSSITAGPSAAHVVHTQDLQHQLSVKTLEHRSLRQEYDRLLQKLERERVRCATYEKKSAIGDIELNAVTAERDQLQVQIASLDGEIEKLQESRDEERRKNASSGAQYMQMVALSNQIQAKNAEDKAKWLTEREAMEKRLESQGFSPPKYQRPDEATQRGSFRSRETPSGESSQGSPRNKSDLNSALSSENARLYNRVLSLELALRNVKHENDAVQAAAQSIMLSSRSNRDLVDRLLPG